MLPAKLDTAKLAVAKVRPKHLLSIRLIAPQLAGFVPNVFHACALARELPLPLIRGRGNYRRPPAEQTTSSVISLLTRYEFLRLLSLWERTELRVVSHTNPRLIE